MENLPNDLKSKIYDDAIRPSAQELGKTIALLPRAINVALQPIEKYLYTKEINFQKCKDLIIEKSKNKSPDQITTPEPYVAVPAFQALTYAIDSDELRNAYANLLSSAIDRNTKDYVHPAFVESLRHLSPVDVKVFDSILKNKLYAIVDLVSLSASKDTLPTPARLLETNISGLNISSHLIQSASFDLLSRLGFIDIRESSLTDQNYYNLIYESKEYQDLLKTHSIHPNLHPIKKHFIITNLGDLFAQVCLDA